MSVEIPLNVVRDDHRGSGPEAELVMLETSDATARFVLDDGVTIELDRAELLDALAA